MWLIILKVIIYLFNAISRETFLSVESKNKNDKNCNYKKKTIQTCKEISENSDNLMLYLLLQIISFIIRKKYTI